MLIANLLPLLTRYSLGFDLVAGPDDTVTLTVIPRKADGTDSKLDPGETSIYLDKPPFTFGGAGLVSSPRDYDRFLLMLANFGQIGGTRLLSENAVRAATGNLLPPGVPRPSMLGPASDFGAGGRVGIGAEAGIFGWGGAAGTVGTVDMHRGIRAGLYVQFMPPDALPLLSEYQQALKEDVMALIEPKS